MTAEEAIANECKGPIDDWMRTLVLAASSLSWREFL